MSTHEGFLRKEGPLFEGELLPCPFCGTSNALQDHAFCEDGPYVVCGKCGAGGPGRRTHILAAKAWNRRKSPPNQRGDSK